MAFKRKQTRSQTRKQKKQMKPKKGTQMKRKMKVTTRNNRKGNKKVARRRTGKKVKGGRVSFPETFFNPEASLGFEPANASEINYSSIDEALNGGVVNRPGQDLVTSV